MRRVHHGAFRLCFTHLLPALPQNIMLTNNMALRWLAPLLAWHVAPAVAQPLPRPDHIVIVVEENKSFAQIIGNPDAPYINALAMRGALFTQSYGITHPSQPNYLALFSGSTHGISSNTCPLELSGPASPARCLKRG